MGLDLVKALNVSPRWLRKLFNSVTQGRGPLGAAYDRLVYRYSPEQIPPVPALSSLPVRVVIGPANEAEQGYQWARAFERYLPGVSAVAMMGFDPGGYQVKADLNVPTPVCLRATEFHDAFAEYLENCTHLLFESGVPLLGRRYNTDAFAEMRHFRDVGLGVAMLFHGSDLRLPSQHVRESEWSPFRNPGVPSALLEEKARHNIAQIGELGVPTFVSTPDLLRYLPASIWCPVVIDPAEWRVERGGEPRHPPVVLHAPSNPLIKGSVLIEPALRSLEAEGLIEYRKVTGLMHEQMRGQYAEADVVLDQFLIGSYGVAACEALASGCRVIGHVDDFTRRAVVESTGVEVPIVEATIDTLEQVLRRVVADRNHDAESRESGFRFVEQVHNGRRSAEAVRGFLSLDGALY